MRLRSAFIKGTFCLGPVGHFTISATVLSLPQKLIKLIYNILCLRPALAKDFSRERLD